MIDFFITMTENYYWFGVFVAFICIYGSIWIYKSIITNPYVYKNNPLILLFLLLSFLSWYAIGLLIIIYVVSFAIWVIVYGAKSIHHDFFDNSDSL